MTKIMGATPEQKKASNPAASAWVGANAGSGKTHVLVDRVIRLMLDGVDPAAILCLTYTKAAATEMAGRLHERLGEWIGISDAELKQRLIKIGCERLGDKTLARARRLFTAALETPGGFKIQTIHAFCERILQLFPVEAGMAPGFDVLESKQASQLLENSRDLVLFEAQKDEDSPLAKAFATIVRHAQTDAFDDLLAGLIAKRRELHDLLATYGSLENVGAELRRQLSVNDGDTADGIQRQFLECDRATIQRLIPVLQGSGANNQKTAVQLVALLREKNAGAAEAIYRQLFLLSGGEAAKQPKSVITEKLQKDNPWIAEWLMPEFARVLTLIETHDNLVRVEATLSLLMLATEITARFEAAKQRLGAYDFEDLILRTRDLLTDRGSSQWILYKLDRGFEHVLVDEAQDTSLAQWQIVNAITEEFFAGQGAREMSSRTLFVVGDHKQSIYSFQGADPAAFEHSREKFRRQILDVGQGFHDVDLTISYRSTAEVLNTVDAVFAEGTRARAGLDGMTPHVLHHESNRKDERGLFELWPLIRPDEQAEPEPWQAPIDREPAKSPKRMLARKIATTIKSWIGRRHITALNRTVEAGDILILFRTRNILFDALISELRRVNVPVAGADRLRLSKNIAVLDVMALVRFVLLPADDYSLACILKSPLVPQPLSEEELFDLAHDRGSASLWARLLRSASPDCQAACQQLQDWQQGAELLRPFEFLSAVLVKARKAILSRLGSEAGDALDALLEAALSYEENHSSSLSGFADWFVSEDAEIKRNMESGRGEVRLMTIHGAKGLESSIVILPDTTGMPSDRKASGLMFIETDVARPRLPLWRLSKLFQSPTIEGWKGANRETGLEEYRRLLYVAMTRARDELYICGCHNRNELNEDSWYAMVETALQNPQAGSALLRAVQSGDGSACWRHGPDPTWGEAALAKLPTRAELPDWLGTGPAFPDTAQKTWAPTRVSGAPHAVGSQAAVARGGTMHKILQEIPPMPPDRGLEFARRLLEKNRLDPNLANRILDLISNPDYSDFFGTESQAEVGIGAILPNGQRLTGKIDRLVIRDRDILVLDYKTDWNVPETLPPDHPYVAQMAAYVLALRQAYGDKTIRPAILWTAGPRLDWISEDYLQRAISSMAAI